MEKENKMPKYLLSTEGKVYETSELTKCNHPDYSKLWFTKGGAPVNEKKLSDDLFYLFDRLIVVWGDEEEPDIIKPDYYLERARERLFYANVTKVFGAVWRNDGLKYIAVIDSQKAPWRKF